MRTDREKKQKKNRFDEYSYMEKSPEPETDYKEEPINKRTRTENDDYVTSQPGVVDAILMGANQIFPKIGIRANGYNKPAHFGHNLSARFMEFGRTHSTITPFNYMSPEQHSTIMAYSPGLYKPGLWGGVLQSTYLMPIKSNREKAILNSGYIKGKEGDYGPFRDEVKRTYRRSFIDGLLLSIENALGAYRDPVTGEKINNPIDEETLKKAIPVYQTAPDSTDSAELIPIYTGNIAEGNFGETNPATDIDLTHAGTHSFTLYYDPKTKETYVKKWDLNDYGGGKGVRSKDPRAYAVDFFGHPAVVTTGFQRESDLLPRNYRDEYNNIPLYSSIYNKQRYSKKPLTAAEKNNYVEGYSPVRPKLNYILDLSNSDFWNRDISDPEHPLILDEIVVEGTYPEKERNNNDDL